MLPAAALIIGPLLSPEENLETLEPAIIVRKYLKGSRVDFLAKCASGEWDDVVGIFRSNLSSEVVSEFRHVEIYRR
jgi:glyoxylate reductase